jgi:hypothetical protein
MKINNRYLTAQEHHLFGSTLPEIYTSSPYTPRVVIDGEISAEECNEVRKKFVFLDQVPGVYWGVKFIQCRMSLEELNLNRDSPDYGQTLRDPALLGLNYKLEGVGDLSEQFPYKRESSPRVELKDE